MTKYRRHSVTAEQAAEALHRLWLLRDVAEELRATAQHFQDEAWWEHDRLHDDEGRFDAGNQLLRAIHRARRAELHAQRITHAGVTAARGLGVSWPEIAHMLGTSPQAAQKKHERGVAT